jgi:hypothetical protein
MALQARVVTITTPSGAILAHRMMACFRKHGRQQPAKGFILTPPQKEQRRKEGKKQE